MNRYTLAVVDTTGIQDYIFGTNQLKQNVGASYLVDCATRKWVVESLSEPNNVKAKDLDDLNPFTDQTIENDQIAAEIVYAGGGNTMIIFSSNPDAINFAQRLTRKILLNAPGLDLVLAHEEFDWDGGKALGGKNGVVNSVMKKLALKKANYPISTPLLGLGVTASCTFTGLPAVYEDKEQNRLISSEVKAKVDVGKKANDRLKDIFAFGDYEMAMDFDDFGRTFGESSYIAVVHTDGNGMSNRIQRIQERFNNSYQNREYIQEMRSFSLSIQKATKKSLQSTIDKLIHAIEQNKVIKLNDKKLPFRPIVFGGDDVTFVCDGRLGLSLAAHYLEIFSSQKLSDKEQAHCRAGIAVVKTHYPFARAYALGEELCRSAKEYIKMQKEDSGEEDLTAMDWHFAVNGLARNLNDVRNREYTVPKEGSLLMRPVRLNASKNEWKSWDLFANIIKEFQSDDLWKGRRNKIKALREALRAGRDEVIYFRKAYGLPPLPKIMPYPDMADQGWQGGKCGYFDAIEAMDFFISLDADGGSQ
jgi:hypothetical protein